MQFGTPKRRGGSHGGLPRYHPHARCGGGHHPTLTETFVKNLAYGDGTLLCIRAPEGTTANQLRAEWWLHNGKHDTLPSVPTNRDDTICFAIPAQYPTDLKQLTVRVFQGSLQVGSRDIDVPPSKESWPRTAPRRQSMMIGKVLFRAQVWRLVSGASTGGGNVKLSFQVATRSKADGLWQFQVAPLVPQYGGRLPDSRVKPIIDVPLNRSMVAIGGEIQNIELADEVVTFHNLTVQPNPVAPGRLTLTLAHETTATAPSGVRLALIPWKGLGKDAPHTSLGGTMLDMLCRIDLPAGGDTAFSAPRLASADHPIGISVAGENGQGFTNDVLGIAQFTGRLAKTPRGRVVASILFVGKPGPLAELRLKLVHRY